MVSGKGARLKGIRYERDIVSKLKKIFPQAKRHLEYQPGEATGDDIEGTGNLRIQCKRNKSWAPISKIEELKGSHGIHCLVTKGDKKPDVICLYLSDFLSIIDDIGVVYAKD